MQKKAVDFISSCPKHIKERLRSVDFDAGAMILHQGDMPEFVYFLIAGDARVYTLILNGSSYLQHIYSPGDLFGEFEALNQRPYLACVQASSACKTIQIENDAFIEWINNDPDFSLVISQQTADKLYQSMLDAVVNIVYPLKYRVLYFLWNVAQNGSNTIRKEDIIEGLGSNERSINRIIRDLVNELVIDYDRGAISISDLDAIVHEMKRYE
jgi:CRP-like cAMP-binding protein